MYAILQENFIDTYHNLTYKGIAALRWIDSYCGQAVFVLKTDDDIFVNMYTLIRYLKKMSRTVDRPRSLLMCLVWESMPVLREGKWKVCCLYASLDFVKLSVFCHLPVLPVLSVKYSGDQYTDFSVRF